MINLPKILTLYHLDRASFSSDWFSINFQIGFLKPKLKSNRQYRKTNLNRTEIIGSVQFDLSAFGLLGLYQIGSNGMG